MNDTEAKATSRYVMGGFGRGHTGYKRYAKYVNLLNTGKQTVCEIKWCGEPVSDGKFCEKHQPPIIFKLEDKE